MDRKAARALAVSTITALSAFDLVQSGAPDSFLGKAKVALVTSRALQLVEIARGLYEVVNQITVSIYIQRAAGGEAAAEDALDDRAQAIVLALHATGSFLAEQSDAGGSGAPNRIIDGTTYRVERLPFTVLDEGSP
jgi:hypothetical protein